MGRRQRMPVMQYQIKRDLDTVGAAVFRRTDGTGRAYRWFSAFEDWVLRRTCSAFRHWPEGERCTVCGGLVRRL